MGMYGKLQEPGLTEVISLVHTSTIWGQNPVFTPWAFSGLTMGSDGSLMAARWQVFFPSWVPSGLTSSLSVVAAISDDCDIIC